VCVVDRVELLFSFLFWRPCHPVVGHWMHCMPGHDRSALQICCCCKGSSSAATLLYSSQLLINCTVFQLLPPLLLVVRECNCIIVKRYLASYMCAWRRNRCHCVSSLSSPRLHSTQLKAKRSGIHIGHSSPLWPSPVIREILGHNRLRS
jgi:hypothetical protein